MLLSADNKSDLARAKTCEPGSQSRTATRSARASQVSLCLDDPTLALNLRRSFFVCGDAYCTTGLKLSNSTPATLQGARICLWQYHAPGNRYPFHGPDIFWCRVTGCPRISYLSGNFLEWCNWVPAWRSAGLIGPPCLGHPVAPFSSLGHKEMDSSGEPRSRSGGEGVFLYLFHC